MLVSVNGVPLSDKSEYVMRSGEMLCYALLSNLLKNAMEAAPEHSTVKLDFSHRDGHVFTIHNRGVIPESIRESFFEKFVTSGKQQGTGLGTYTAHLIATSLGGTFPLFHQKPLALPLRLFYRKSLRVIPS